MFVDFIIAFCTIGMLICIIYIIYQTKKLKAENSRYENFYETDEEPEEDEVFAVIEDNVYPEHKNGAVL